MKNSSLVFVVIGLFVFVSAVFVLVLGQQASFLSTRLWRGSVYPAGAPVEVPAELPDQDPNALVPEPDQGDADCKLICQQSCGSFDSAEQVQTCLGECLGLCETEY